MLPTMDGNGMSQGTPLGTQFGSDTVRRFSLLHIVYIGSPLSRYNVMKYLKAVENNLAIASEIGYS